MLVKIQNLTINSMKGILQYILNQSYHGDCYIVLQSEKVESKMNFQASWVLNKINPLAYLHTLWVKQTFRETYCSILTWCLQKQTNKQKTKTKQ